MKPDQPSSVPPIVILAFAAELIFATLHIVIVGFFPDIHGSLTELVDLNGEGNLPSWFSSIQLFLIAMLFLVLTIDGVLKNQRPWAAALAVIAFVFLSADEAAQLHERFGQITDVFLPGRSRLNTSLWRTGIGNMILGGVAVAFVVWGWRSVRRHLRFEGKWKLVFGMMIFIGAASIPEALSNFITSRSVMVFERVVEEIGEMVGITLVLWGTLKLLSAHDVQLEFSQVVGARKTAGSTEVRVPVRGSALRGDEGPGFALGKPAGTEPNEPLLPRP